VKASDGVGVALRSAVRDIPDFPQPGIIFRDITPLLGDSALFAASVGAMTDPYRDVGITHVVAIESRGFILGAPVALALRAGFIPIRKPGKLPHASRRTEYALEYASGALEVHEDACAGGARVLVVDDVLATGGTAAAAALLTRELGAEVVGYSFLIELRALRGRDRLGGARVAALLEY
jgi:adenine phosphoribosyltransferase